MQIKPEHLEAQLVRGLARLYVLHGDEPLLVAEAADAIRRAARERGYSDREVLVVGTGFRWDALELAAGNLSLFGGNKLIDLRIPTGRPGREGAEALVRHCRSLHEGVLTLVSLPELDWQTRKAAWYQALENAGASVELKAPGLAQLPGWIARRLERQGQSAAREALEFIAEHVEGNLLAAHQEIQKLTLLHPPGELTLAQVQDAVLNVARYDVEKLRAALLEGDAARCARLIEGLRGEGAAAPLVLWAYAAEIRALWGVRSRVRAGMPIDAALRAERIFDPERAARVRRSAGEMSLRQLRVALSAAARIDRMAKGLARGDIWDEFLQLALLISRRRRRTA